MKRFLMGFALGWGLLTSVSACGKPCRRIAGLDFDAPVVSRYSSALPSTNAGFAVFGDTQRTSWQECAIGREVNDKETKQLIKAIADAKPAFAVIVGDLVFHGADEGHWAYFDHLALPLRNAKVPILPAAGNHEYWGNNERALESMRARFERLTGNTWYADTYAGIGLIVLDTNEDEIGDDAWQRQVAWYGETLAGFERDDSISAVIVFGHHAPYTNSPVVDGDENVQEAFVSGFCASRKTAAFMTGHAHGYEHFVRGPDQGCGDRARHFIVTAGGGGPRPDELRPAGETGLTDEYAAPAPRPFNYVWVEPGEDALSLEVRGFDKGESAVRVIEQVTIAYAR